MSGHDDLLGAAGGCEHFRSLLQRHLEASLDSSGDVLHELSWHEHLLGCTDCRALLEAEEALEHFLASLPEPKLPPALARRVVRRLRARRRIDPVDRLLELDVTAPTRPGLAGRVLAGLADERLRSDGDLDRLLEQDPVDVPADLAARVLSGLRPARRERALEELLDLDEVSVPAGLSGRVLTGLADHRHRVARPRLLRSGSWIWGAVAAGLVALVGGVWLLRPEGAAAPTSVAEGPREGIEDAPSALEPDEELLAALPVLEVWDLLEEHGDEVELVADPVYEVLLEFEEEIGATPPDGREPGSTEKPSKG